MKKIKHILLLTFVLMNFSFANNIRIANARLGIENTTGHYRNIIFDVSWENSWRRDISTQSNYAAPYNWDAAWIFIKYQAGSGEWKHATLSANSSEHKAPTGSTITPASDGKGVFIYRSANGVGIFSLTNVKLKWNYGTDGVSDGASITIKVLGIEMVYIPQGSFYAGDYATSSYSFKSGSNDNSPWYITNENAINVTNTTSGGYYCSGSAFTIPSTFPKGFAAIYCMKYEICEGQYVQLLNSLNSTQANNRFPNAYNSARNMIYFSTGSYYTTTYSRACGYLGWFDGCAYADWSSLRPMTELEFEKICRGTNKPISGEYAWGSTNIVAATNISGAEDGTEYITNNGANCNYNWTSFTGGDGSSGPLRVGIFARSNSTREQSGASYYGVMDMSGSVYDQVVSVVDQDNRSFTGIHGDGILTSDGNQNVTNWPTTNPGFRGGDYSKPSSYLRISERIDISGWGASRIYGRGFRCVRTAP